MGAPNYNLWSDKRSPYYVLPGGISPYPRPGKQQSHMPLPKRRKRISASVNFDRYAEEGRHFINEVAAYMRCDRNTAGRLTRAVLQSLRDRLPPDDAIEFAQGLPMALKGLFIDQYDISRTPVRLRHRDDFIQYIRIKNRFSAFVDFHSTYDVVRAFQAVFRALRNYMDKGQIRQILKLLPAEIAMLTEKY